MGWDPVILQKALDTCGLETGGDVTKCPALLPYYDTDAANACREQELVVNEDIGILKGLTKLPGCKQIA